MTMPLERLSEDEEKHTSTGVTKTVIISARRMAPSQNIMKRPLGSRWPLCS